MEIITPLLHGLAYIGVYILNILIYEIFAIVAWLLVALVAHLLPISDDTWEEVTGKTMIVLLILLAICCLLFLFNIGLIVPYPTFS